MCTPDIRVYAQTNDADVFHYRDKSGLESDLIVRLRDGRWAAIEVKLGKKQIDEFAAITSEPVRETDDTTDGFLRRDYVYTFVKQNIKHNLFR